MKKSTHSTTSFQRRSSKTAIAVEQVEKSSSSKRTSSLSGKSTQAKTKSLQRMNELQVIDNEEDVTPKPIESKKASADFNGLHHTKSKISLKNLSLQPDFTRMSKPRTISSGALKVSMDDIVHGISQALLILDEMPTQTSSSSTQSNDVENVIGEDAGQKISPFIKIYLRQTEDILLFEQRSTTVPMGTEDAERVEKENKAYDYITKGKGRLRRKADSEAQTTSVLFKSRDANTDTIQKMNTASYVSNFDMFDTYQDIQSVKSSLKVDDSKTLDVTTYKVDGVDACERIGLLPQFELAQMVIQRILAGNVFKEQQRRFRNMFLPDPLSMKVDYLYQTKDLWVLNPRPEAKEQRAVSCMSWCPSNGDILAVGYGIFTRVKNLPQGGHVSIWSIKNPVNAEKVFEYASSVSSVEFSPYRPQLLAVGLYDGSVEVRDITTERCSVVAISHRDTSPGFEPVLDIKWIGLDPGETADIEPFITVCQDGRIMKYRLINSPYLLGYTHAILDRVEGTIEGLPLERSFNTLAAVRQPQLLGVTRDPLNEDIFYAISNEGVIYKCSTNYPQQHLSLLQTHEGPVYCMEFSPWSPKLFLTSGNDWCVRIWIDGVYQPLITLTNQQAPINSVCWSKTHSTIIVSINREAVDVWDIRRSTLKPMSSTNLETSYLTLAKFSNCGRSIAVGTERGAVHMCALEEMPFPPHFQYDELESAIFNALKPYPDLMKEVKGLGYFGYPKEKEDDI